MVIWTKPAQQDLRQVHDYIARDSKFYAQKVTQDIVDRSEKLADFPEIGRVVPEIGEETIRELIVYSYRMIYEYTPAGIHVLTLIHGRRNFSADYLKARCK